MKQTDHHIKANGAHGADEIEELRRLIEKQNQKIAAIEARFGGNLEPQDAQPEPQDAQVETPNKGGALGLLPRGDELLAIYHNNRLRCAVSVACTKKGGQDLLKLLLDAADAGLLAPNDIGVRDPAKSLPLRVLFPWLPGVKHGYSGKFNLRNKPDRDIVRRDILAVAIANRGAVMSNPDLLEQLVYEERLRRVRADQERKAIEVLKDGEAAIIIYGQMVWPRVDHRFGEYTYAQICAAARTFRDFDTYMTGSAKCPVPPGSRAIHIRNATKFMRRYCKDIITKDPEARANIDEVYSLIHWLVGFLEKPVGEGECRWPQTIHTE